jgi:enoyl-CoA hydratase/carnithine racemase
MAKALRRDEGPEPGSFVRLSWPLPDVAWLTLENPPANQLTMAIRAELHGRLASLATDGGLRALVLSGSGRGFSAGNDLQELGELAPTEGAAFAADWDELYLRIREFPAPVVAAAHGFALGGGFEILLSCDLRVLASGTKLGCTAAKIGVVTSTYSLVRQLGAALAQELFFTARSLDAEEAFRRGLVNRVVPQASLEPEVLRLCAQIAEQPIGAVRLGKRLMNLAHDLSRSEHDQLQQRLFAELTDGDEHRVAIQDFVAGLGRTAPEPLRE